LRGQRERHAGECGKQQTDDHGSPREIVGDALFYR